MDGVQFVKRTTKCHSSTAGNLAMTNPEDRVSAKHVESCHLGDGVHGHDLQMLLAVVAAAASCRLRDCHLSTAAIGWISLTPSQQGFGSPEHAQPQDRMSAKHVWPCNFVVA